MTREEKMARLEQVQNIRFMLSMKDRWDSKDYDRDHELFREQLSLEKELEEK